MVGKAFGDRCGFGRRKSGRPLRYQLGGLGSFELSEGEDVGGVGPIRALECDERGAGTAGPEWSQGLQLVGVVKDDEPVIGPSEDIQDVSCEVLA